MKRVVNRRFAKTKEYAAVLEKIEKQGHCPFCPKDFKYSKKPILKTKNGWFVTENSWPYKNSQNHLLLISTQHKENFVDLTIQDFSAVKELVNWSIKKFKIRGGGLALRFGDTEYTGATVYHLHFHLIYPKPPFKNKNQTVFFPIG